MQGLGNDFVVLTAFASRWRCHPSSCAISATAIRRRLRPDSAGRKVRLAPDVDFRYRIFNADGGEVEQCGNGARCFVRFVHEQGLTGKTEIRVETMKGHRRV